MIVIERTDDGSYSAYVPDLSGCVACGETPNEARTLIAEAAQLHVASLREHGEPVPAPAAQTAVVHAA